MGSEAELLVFASGIYHLPDVRTWTHFLTSLCFSFLIYKIEDNNSTYSIKFLLIIKELTHVKYLEQCLLATQKAVNKCLLLLPIIHMEMPSQQVNIWIWRSGRREIKFTEFWENLWHWMRSPGRMSRAELSSRNTMQAIHVI